MTTQASKLREVLNERFGGLLMGGKHNKEDGACCAVELCRTARGLPFGDTPVFLDYRALNDAPWSSNAVRTEHMLPMMEALFDFGDWSKARQTKWARTVALRTIREVLPIALEAAGVDAAIVKACREAPNLRAAEEAAARAAAAAAAGAARAAAAVAAAARAAAAEEAAAWAAAAAAAAAAGAARAAAAAVAADRLLILACAIWREAA
jgi:hypothetical protein